MAAEESMSHGGDEIQRKQGKVCQVCPSFRVKETFQDAWSDHVTCLSINPTTSQGSWMESSLVTCPNQDTLPVADEGAQPAFEHVALRAG